jgi:1,4-dihydroxy-2-naphthoate octaprenyltransferase
VTESKTKAWIRAFRLRTLPLALACIGLGSFLAAYDKRFNLAVLLLSGLTTLFLQILSNLSNDYGDSVHGADNVERSGPARTVQSGLISAGEMKMAILIFSLLALLSGLSLLIISFDKLGLSFVILLILGLAAIWAAINYTVGKNPYGYAGFGDLFVILFFGILGVMGTYYLHTGHLESSYFLPALACGFLATAVLNINNIRDIESDKKAGKKSIPVRIGRKNAVLYHWFLLLIPFLLVTAFVLMHYRSPIQFLFLISLPLIIKNGIAVSKARTSGEIDPFLKQLAMTTLVFILAFGAGLLI